MCGIAGFMRRSTASDGVSVGDTLLDMSLCLQHRGWDSAGIALFSASSRRYSLRVRLEDDRDLEPQAIYRAGGSDLFDIRGASSGFLVSVRDSTAEKVAKIVADLETGIPGALVTGGGNGMQVEKELGTAESLREKIGSEDTTHGISHLRMATESRIDPAHAQPFWGRPYPDIVVSHNGHVTNYDRLRIRYEGLGFSFASHNDSEIIGVLIGEAIDSGLPLGEAVKSVVCRLDGSFAVLIATADGIAAARDPFATKPLLYAENDTCVAMASEQRPLQRLFGGAARIREIQPKEVRVWEKA